MIQEILSTISKIYLLVMKLIEIEWEEMMMEVQEEELFLNLKDLLIFSSYINL